jgi:hypothetical protein
MHLQLSKLPKTSKHLFLGGNIPDGTGSQSIFLIYAEHHRPGDSASLRAAPRRRPPRPPLPPHHLLGIGCLRGAAGTCRAMAPPHPPPPRRRPPPEGYHRRAVTNTGGQFSYHIIAHVGLTRTGRWSSNESSWSLAAANSALCSLWGRDEKSVPGGTNRSGGMPQAQGLMN